MQTDDKTKDLDLTTYVGPNALGGTRKEEFLHDALLATLEGVHWLEKPGKSRDVLQATKQRKRGYLLGRMFDIV